MRNYIVDDTVMFVKSRILSSEELLSDQNFQVLKIEEVPAISRKGVGHRQWLTIETLEGRTKYSGWFFDDSCKD